MCFSFWRVVDMQYQHRVALSYVQPTWEAARLDGADGACVPPCAGPEPLRMWVCSTAEASLRGATRARACFAEPENGVRV